VPTVSDDLARAALDGIRADLASKGYALTNDEAIGLPEKFRTNFEQTYFNDHRLRHDDGDQPVDRKRARDVILYRWHDDDLEVEEHETITITDRAGIPGKRDHLRVWLLDDPQAKELVRTFLSLVPRDLRQAESTFGVNLFRTFTNVVSKPHQDNEKFVIIYVLNRIGDGAKTYLYRSEDVVDGKPTAEPVLEYQLNPGEILIFDDEAFMHDTSPLVARPGESTQRDVLVCTVDYWETYLAATA
jgi:2OG-Fe dioxygenase